MTIDPESNGAVSVNKNETADAGMLRVLLVDDEPRLLEFFADMLSDLGYSVSATGDPRHALGLISEEKFDIVFLDQFMGPVRGADLMQEMASRDPDLYFVIVTANDSTDLAVECLKKGATDFITKPFFEDAVIRSIGFVTRKRDLDRRQRGLVAELENRVREKTEELVEVNFSVLTTLVRAVEKRDPGTYGHSMRVCTYAERIAGQLNMSAGERDDLRTAALLHDIGKIGISDAVLGKPAPLTAGELEIIRRHPANGVEILKPLGQYRAILPAILHHHERYDGTGYPAGLRGRDIPFPARIIAVADTYDAIVSNRSYRFGADASRALDTLREETGKQLDPEIVRMFLSVARQDGGIPRLDPVEMKRTESGSAKPGRRPVRGGQS